MTAKEKISFISTQMKRGAVAVEDIAGICASASSGEHVSCHIYLTKAAMDRLSACSDTQETRETGCIKAVVSSEDFKVVTGQANGLMPLPMVMSIFAKPDCVDQKARTVVPNCFFRRNELAVLISEPEDEPIRTTLTLRNGAVLGSSWPVEEIVEDTKTRFLKRRINGQTVYLNAQYENEARNLLGDLTGADPEFNVAALVH